MVQMKKGLLLLLFYFFKTITLYYVLSQKDLSEMDAGTMVKNREEEGGYHLGVGYSGHGLWVLHRR